MRIEKTRSVARPRMRAAETVQVWLLPAEAAILKRFCARLGFTIEAHLLNANTSTAEDDPRVMLMDTTLDLYGALVDAMAGGKKNAH